MNHRGLFLALLGGALLAAPAAAQETHRVEISAVETDVAIDNAGNTRHMWTFGGAVPGPVVRVRQGDTVDFSLHNDPDNEESHSMDFHAARVDVLEEFAEVAPGETKEFSFTADYPGIFIYHCGADAMSEHIARGMYGVIIVDPAEGYGEEYPEPDREYVLVQGDLFEAGNSPEAITMGRNWEASLINGKVFHYSPVHDPNASVVLEGEPGERVRIFYVNANVNESAALHPIAGIWDRVWDNGNPKNVRHGMQTVEVPPAHGAVFDLVAPEDRPTNNAIVDHRMRHALNGAVSLIMFHADADPDLGRGDKLIPR